MMTRKWRVPLAYVLLFSICSGIGAGWGLMVRSPHLSMEDAPLYPQAESLVNISATAVIASLAPAAPTPVGEVPFTELEFVTNDSPEAVAAFYRNTLRNQYGFVGDTTETAPGITVLRFGRRALRDAWVYEILTVRISAESSGQTKVYVDLEVRPAP
jgi:hypothetical protein